MADRTDIADVASDPRHPKAPVPFSNSTLPNGSPRSAPMKALRITADGSLRWSDMLLALALFAAIVRSLIPVGFMPDVQDGQVTMVICTVDGARKLDGSDRAPTEADGAMAATHAPCAFTGLATLAPPPSAPIVSLPVSIEAGLVARDETPADIAAPDHRPQAPRAPPSRQT